jgi:MFS transporter, SP family, arabinose:H+ symporter
MRMTSTLLRSTVVGALGGFLFGFDTVVIAGTTGQLREIFHLSPHQMGDTVSIALWGTVAGCALAGPVGQRMGGRNALRIMAALYIASAMGCAFAWNWPALMIFRFIGGLGIGGSSVLGPVYIAELAPAAWRGRLVGTFQVNVVIGILVAYISNWVVANLGLGLAEWRWQLGIAFFPALAFALLLFTIPHSSRFLITRGEDEEALAVLHKMGIENGPAELDVIRASLHSQTPHSSEPLFQRSLRFPIFLAVSVALFNQLSGINAVLYYSNDIFAAAGLSRLSTFSQSIYIGLANLVGTAFGMLLIDKLGRKMLLLIGAVGTFLCLFMTALIFRSGVNQGRVVWLLVIFICFFAFSQGAVIWVYISEVFPNRVRAKGQSLGAGTHWVSDAVIAMLFPIAVAHLSRSAPFFFFAAMTALQFVVVLFVFPETKGVTLEQLQARLQHS